MDYMQQDLVSQLAPDSTMLVVNPQGQPNRIYGSVLMQAYDNHINNMVIHTQGYNRVQPYTGVLWAHATNLILEGSAGQVVYWSDGIASTLLTSYQVVYEGADANDYALAQWCAVLIIRTATGHRIVYTNNPAALIALYPQVIVLPVTIYVIDSRVPSLSQHPCYVSGKSWVIAGADYTPTYATVEDGVIRGVVTSANPLLSLVLGVIDPYLCSITMQISGSVAYRTYYGADNMITAYQQMSGYSAWHTVTLPVVDGVDRGVRYYSANCNVKACLMGGVMI